MSVTFSRAPLRWDAHTRFAFLRYIADWPSHFELSKIAPLSFPLMRSVLHTVVFSYNIIRLKGKEYVLAQRNNRNFCITE